MPRWVLCSPAHRGEGSGAIPIRAKTGLHLRHIALDQLQQQFQYLAGVGRFGAHGLATEQHQLQFVFAAAGLHIGKQLHPLGLPATANHGAEVDWRAVFNIGAEPQEHGLKGLEHGRCCHRGACLKHHQKTRQSNSL